MQNGASVWLETAAKEAGRALRVTMEVHSSHLIKNGDCRLGLHSGLNRVRKRRCGLGQPQSLPHHRTGHVTKFLPFSQQPVQRNRRSRGGCRADTRLAALMSRLV